MGIFEITNGFLEFGAVAIGYLLGSIPVAYIMARRRAGIDIRNVDIGNVGGGSVLRQVGIREGVLVILLDMAKGAAAIYAARALGVVEPWVYAAGFAAVIGHSFPVYLGFRGGRGVASMLGIFWVLTPKAMAVIFFAILVIILIKRRQFIHFIFKTVVILAPFYPALVWLLYQDIILTLFAVICGVFLVVKTQSRKVAKLMRKKSVAVEGDDGYAAELGQDTISSE